MENTFSSPAGKNGQSVPRAIGQTLATLQHLADLVVDWGFKKLRRAGEYPLSERKKGNKVLGTVGKSAQFVARFLGSVGESYFDWYEKLKARKGVIKE